MYGKDPPITFDEIEPSVPWKQFILVPDNITLKGLGAVIVKLRLI